MTFKTKEIHARAELCHGRHSLSYIASYWLGAAYSPNCCRSWQLGWACRLESTGWGGAEGFKVYPPSRVVFDPRSPSIQGCIHPIARSSSIRLQSQSHLQSRFVYNPKVIFNLGSSTIPSSSSIQGRLPSKVAIHSRSSFTQGCFSSKVVLHPRSSSIQVCLPQK